VGTSSVVTRSSAARSAGRLAFVGWSNPHGTTPLDVAPVGATGWRLWKMTGLSRDDYMSLLRLNAADFSSYRDLWSAVTIDGCGRVIFLGRRAADFAGVCKDFFDVGYYPALMCEVAVIPHPSGKNRLYNDATVRLRAEAFLRELLR
jgi:hypothetical protein